VLCAKNGLGGLFASDVERKKLSEIVGSSRPFGHRTLMAQKIQYENFFLYIEML
jgi:hypothetical protein